MKKLIYILGIILMVSCNDKSESCSDCNDRTHNVASGLSNYCIYDIEEDSCGQIWFATFRGLNRFDSRDYYHYFADFKDSLSIPHDQIRDLIVDKKNRLWVGTVDGLCHYTGTNDFRRHPQLETGMVFQMEHGPDSVLFMNVNYSLKALHAGPDTIETLLDVINIENTFNPKLLVSDDKVWIVGRSAIIEYDYSKRSITDSIAIPAAANNGFLIDDEIWLSSDPQTLIFNTKTKQFSSLPESLQKHPLFKNAELSFIRHYEEEIYIIQTASDGIFLYDRGKNEILHQADNGFPFEAPEFKVSTIFCDSRKNIWFGGQDQGFTAHYRYLDRFNNDNKLRTLLSGKSVLSTEFDLNNDLWLTTRSYGIFVYNSDNGDIWQITPYDVAKKIPGKDIFFNFVFADSKGNIWLSLTNGETLKCRFDWKSGLHVLARYPLWTPMEMSEDATGNIWVGTASPYVCYLTPDATEFSYLQVFEGYCFIPAIRKIDDSKILIAGFNQPLKTIDINTREISLLPMKTDMDTFLKRAVFIPTDVLVADDNVWIGTVGNGILHYNRGDSSLNVIPGAACSDISALESDKSGNLWISTLYGLSHYDTKSGKFTNYFDVDGIGGNQFYDRSSSALPSKELLVFGGTHGLTTFNPDEVTRPVEAPLMFQNLKVHNKIVRPGEDAPISEALSLRPDVTLKNHQNSFAISFVAVDFCENPREAYMYMLEGVDRNWVEASQNHEASYANVSPGEYRFRVRLADDEDGSGEITLRVKILQTAWLSWWAILLYVLAGILLAGFCVYFIMKIREERKARVVAMREKEQERRINDMNMRFFANVSHEFRTPLTMISGPIKQLETSSEITENDRKLLSIARTNVDRMLKLVNQLLDFNKLENDALRLEVSDTDIVALLRDVSMSFVLAAKYKQIEFTTFGLEDAYTVPVDTDKVVKIYCNLLSNALKFTPKGGKIRVSFDTIDSENGRRIIIKVENTGHRIPDDKLEKIFKRYYQIESSNSQLSDYRGSGIGLYYARALANMHHGSLVAIQPDFEGACFIFELPADDIYSQGEHFPDQKQVDRYPINDGSVYSEDNPEETNDEANIILVVDDDIQVANYLKVLLSPVYKVVTMFDAKSALQWLAENRPTLIISDVVMPGMNGYELCRHIKSDLDLCHIPVLLVTAKASVENQVEGFEAEANAYITKPFDPILLMSLIGSLLRNRDKAKQLATTSTSMEGVEPEIIAPQDSAFLSELYQLMENELSNTELDVNNISRKMRMSRTKFYYKVKGLTGETPAVFFRTYKLNRATELIKEHRYTLSEIADRTGFSTLSHFSRSFKKQFGVSPSDYQQG